MSDAFKLLLDTVGLWLPALTWLAGQLSATRPGRKIEDGLKIRLKWLKDPEAEKAFHAAFRDGIEQYEKDHGESESAKAVARVLTHIAEHDTYRLDRAMILRQIFASKPDVDSLSDAVKRNAFSLEGMTVPVDKVTAALETLVTCYLRPAFQAHPYFAERVGFAEVLNLLQDIRQAVVEPPPDLESLRREYCIKMAEKYECITMQGISPKVQNRTIGIRMEDVFIPLKARVTDLPEPPMTIRAGQFIEALKQFRSQAIVPGGLSQEELKSPAEFSQSRGMAIQEEYEKAVQEQLLAPAQAEWARSLIEALEAFPSEELVRVRVETLEIRPLLHLPRLVVQGDPGSGKSTLTRYVTWSACSGRPDLIGEEPAARLPIRIRAIHFGEALDRGRVDSLDEYIGDEVGRFLPLIKHALAAGEALILIDGLDEVGKPALRQRVKERVGDFVADPAFDDNQIVITTRIVGYERSGLIGRFPHFTLAELEDEQIREFVDNWYGAIHSEMPDAIDVPSERQQLLDAITSNESIHRLARNPLLLTIIALIKWQGRALPDQRVLLYDAAAQTLIQSWPRAQRQVELDELLIREWLAPVALSVLSDATSNYIDEYSLMELLVESMLHLRSMSEIDARQSSRKMLDNLSLHSGILLPRGTDADGRELYGFLHQTFAEYLSAYCLAGRWEDGKLNLVNYAHDPYWREVLLLMAGHLGTQRRANAGKLIKALRDLNSSPYEDAINRDLLLASRVLADGVPAGPGDLVKSILRELFQVWLNTPIRSLQSDVEEILTDLGGTEYARVLANLANESALDSSHILKLASCLGLRYFEHDLVILLDAEDATVRLDAARLLAEQDDQRGTDAILNMLDDKNTKVRSEALRLLVKRGDPRVVETLLNLSDAEDAGVSFNVVPWLAWRGSRWKVEDLVDLLNVKDAKLLFVTARLLAERDDPRGMDAVVGLLDTEDDRVRLDAARCLAERDDPRGTEAIVDLLDTEDAQIRSAAARWLVEQDDPRGAKAIMGLLDTEDARVRSAATRWVVERDDPQGAEAIVDLLDDENATLRFEAARWLAERGDPRGIDAIVDLLDTENIMVRTDVEQWLAERDDPRVVEALVGLLDAEHGWIRRDAARLLAERDDPQTVEVLIDLLDDEDIRVRLDVIRWRAKRDDPRVIEVLIDLLDDEDARVRLEASRLLAEQEEASAFEAVRDRIELMLKNVEESSYLVPGKLRSVADVAYQFLKRHLTPSGELRRLAKKDI